MVGGGGAKKCVGIKPGLIKCVGIKPGLIKYVGVKPGLIKYVGIKPGLQERLRLREGFLREGLQDCGQGLQGCAYVHKAIVSYF